MSFVHLHNHSDYSLLDGALKVDELVARVKELDMPAVALTDHGNMFGALTFYKSAQKKGIKPIIGMEGYLSADDDLPTTGGKPLMFHIVLLARDRRGYGSLMKLSSKSYIEGFYYKPRITRGWLRDNKEGLVCLSACAHGEVGYNFAQDNPDGAKDAAEFYKELFGEDFYLEVQNHDLEIEDKIRPQIYNLGADMGIKVVATNDCHYLLAEHAKSHEILLSIGTGSTLDDENRFRYSTTQLYVKSEEEMREIFSDHPEALDNTLEVADKCNVAVDFGKMHLPKFAVPETSDAKSVHGYLRECVYGGASCLYEDGMPETVKERLETELKIINDMGFSGYFLIVKDFTDFARANRISVGPGRGSAAGSMVSYCLGITSIDPLKYDLLFERFLNPERVTMPDIDIDFADDRREEVIQYVRKKYGNENVTQIITFGKMMARGVVRDVGRVMGFPYGEVDRLAKLIPFFPGMTLSRALDESPELKAEVDSNPAYAEMMKHCLVLEGLNRNPGTHAAGVVLAPDKLTRFTPLFKSAEGYITSQYDMGILESIGLLKMDFLGLKTLTVIENTLKMISERGEKINIARLPLDDKLTYRLFQNGQTIALFQFESSGMQEYLKKLRPERLEDLIAMNALYRPGPMQFIDSFINRKHGKEQITYPHPSLEPILEETYGIIVYQEQVIRIAHEFAGFSMGKADILRRAMGKKKMDVMESMKKEFIDGVKANGIDPKIGVEIFELIEKFAQYGFNKSHSAGYAFVAYQTGYLKAHYPAEFMAASMTSEMSSGSDRIQKLANECKSIGVEVLPPDVNESGMDFTVSEGRIRFGLKAIKNVGEGPVLSMVEARQRIGGFSNIYEFMEEVDQRQVNRKTLESLVQAGALDTLENVRARLFASIDRLIAYGNAIRDDRDRGQFSIFGGDEGQKSYTQPELPDIPEWSRFDKLGREKLMLGYFVSGHPLEKYRQEVESFSSPVIENLNNMPDQAKVRLCGIITKVDKKLTKKGDMMAVLTVEDFTGSAEVLVFGKAYDAYGGELQEDKMVAIDGRASTKEEESAKVLLDKMVPLEHAKEEFTRSIQLTIESDKFESEKLGKLESLVKANPGKASVGFIYYTNGSTCRLKSAKYTVRVTDGFMRDLSDLLGKENVRLGY